MTDLADELEESEPAVKSSGSAFFWRTVAFGADRGVSIIRTLVLAKLLFPEDFGLLATAVATVELLLVVTNFGLESAVIQMPKPSKADYDTAWTMRLIRNVVVTVVAMLAAPLVARFFDQPDEVVNITRLLALRPVINSLNSIGATRLRRSLDFKPVAVIGATRGIVDTVIAIALATSLGVWAMVWGQLAGAFAAMLISYVVARHRPRLAWSSGARQLSEYGKWVLVASVVAAVGEFGLQALISNLLGGEDLGRFYLAFRFGMLIAIASATIIGDVSFGLFSLRQDDDEGTIRAFRGSTIALMAAVAPVACTLAAVAGPATSSFLSDRWDGLGPVLALLALASIVVAAADAAHPLFLGRGRPIEIAWMHAMRTAILLPLAWLFARQFGLMGAVWAFLIAETAAQVAGFVRSAQMVPTILQGLLRPLSAVVGSSLVGAVVAYALSRAWPTLGGVAVGVLASLLVAWGTALMIDRALSTGLKDALVTMLPKRATAS